MTRSGEKGSDFRSALLPVGSSEAALSKLPAQKVVGNPVERAGKPTPESRRRSHFAQFSRSSFLTGPKETLPRSPSFISHISSSLPAHFFFLYLHREKGMDKIARGIFSSSCSGAFSSRAFAFPNDDESYLRRTDGLDISPRPWRRRVLC